MLLLPWLMGEPGDGPLDEVYATISDWNPSPSLCLIDWQVAEVQQIVTTVTGRGDNRPVQRSTRIMVAVKYRTAAGRLTASRPSFILHLLGTEGSNKAVAFTGTANNPKNAGGMLCP